MILQHLVEGDEAHPVAALVQTVVVETGDLHAEDAAFLAGAHALAGDAIALDLAEGGGLGAGAHHRHGALGVNAGVEGGLVLGHRTPHRGAGAAPAQLQHVGELQTLLASGIVPAVQERHHLFAEAFLVFGAIEVGIDFGIHALLLQDREVVQHLGLVLGGPAKQMLEVELNEAIGVAVLEELGAIEAAFGHLTHKLPNAQVAPLEQRFGAFEALARHHVLVAKHLLIHGADQGSLIGFGTIDPVFLAGGVGVALDAQVGSVGKSHERAGRGEKRGSAGAGGGPERRGGRQGGGVARKGSWPFALKSVAGQDVPGEPMGLPPDPMGSVLLQDDPFGIVTNQAPGAPAPSRYHPAQPLWAL